jgi:Arc/MetJ-type ribon-helix-helix transcriptional regulator
MQSIGSITGVRNEGNMTSNNPFCLRLATADKEDLKGLVSAGIFTNVADAGRGAMRKGIEQIKKERGIAGVQ